MKLYKHIYLRCKKNFSLTFYLNFDIFYHHKTLLETFLYACIYLILLFCLKVQEAVPFKKIYIFLKISQDLQPKI